MQTISNAFSLRCRYTLKITLLLCTAIVAAIYIRTDSCRLLFTVNLILLVGTLFKARISIISIFSFFVFYPLVPAFYQYVTGHSYGILEVSINRGDKFYLKEMLSYVLIFQFFVYIFITKSHFLRNEKLLLQRKLRISLTSARFCCVIAIVCILIMFPYIPLEFIGQYGRMRTFIPGQGWIGLSICALAFAVLSHFEDSAFVKFTSFFVIFWSLSHYERADISGFIILLFFILIARISDFKLKAKYIILGLSAFLLLLSLEYVRSGNTLMFSNIYKRIICQVDASDIAYNYNCIIDFVHKGKLLHGESLLSYLEEIIPVFTSQNRIATIFRNNYFSPGGIHFFGEPLMNFGPIGLILFFFLFLFSINQLVQEQRERRMSHVVYTYVLMLSIRIVWYGIIYALNGLVWYIPLVYFSCRVIDGFVIIKSKRLTFYIIKLRTKLKS